MDSDKIIELLQSYREESICLVNLEISFQDRMLCLAFNSYGNLISEFWMVDGRKHGQYKTFWNDGILKEKGSFISGKKNGRYEYYTKDGIVDYYYDF